MNLSYCKKVIIYAVVALTALFSAGAYLTVLLALMFLIYEDKSNELVRHFKANKAIWMLCISLLLSTFMSKEPIFSAAADVVILIHIVLFLILTIEFTPRDSNKLYTCLSVISLLVCIIGVYQFFSGSTNDINSWVDKKSFGTITRIYSTLQNPNVFGGYLVINLCFFIPKYLSRFSKKDRLLIPNILLLSICLILTYSRGGFISFCIAMAFLFLFKRDKRLVAYMLVMVACFYLYNSLGSINRADLGAMAKDSSNVYRVEIWKSAFKVFLENPGWGHGVGTLWYYLSSYSDKLSRYVLHAHNIYLHIAAEMGIVGLLASLYLVGSELFTAFSLWRKHQNSEESFVFLGFMTCMIAILSHGMFDAVIFIPSISLIFINYFALYKVSSYKFISPFARIKFNLNSFNNKASKDI